MVRIYTSPSCSSCRKVKKWFELEGIPFEERNIFSATLNETELKEMLGETFTTWYESLEENPELTTDEKIKKYEGLEPKGGDTVVDTSTGKIYSFYGEWEYEGKKRFQVGNDKFEKMELPIEDKKRFKVIYRSEK